MTLAPLRNRTPLPLTDQQIAQARADLAATGAAVLAGFVAADEAEAMLAEVEPVLDQAYSKPKVHNVYLVADDRSLPQSHPRNAKVTTTSATLAYDRVPEGALRRLYLSGEMRSALAAILGFDDLHPYADPLAGLNVLTYGDGAETGWHFDNANFVVTLMLRPAEAGGDYQYLPFSRSDNDEGYDQVARMLAEETEGVLSLHQNAGDLVIFRGRHTLHRVTPVQGGRSRVIAVFSYDPEPGRILHEDTRRKFYGRVS